MRNKASGRNWVRNQEIDFLETRGFISFSQHVTYSWIAKERDAAGAQSMYLINFPEHVLSAPWRTMSSRPCHQASQVMWRPVILENSVLKLMRFCFISLKCVVFLHDISYLITWVRVVQLYAAFRHCIWGILTLNALIKFDSFLSRYCE
jgi:hypothetical protein